MVDVHLHYRGAGDEWRAMPAVPVAGSYALEAERRMGELLAQTPRAVGAIAGGKKDSPRGHYTLPRDKEPTLAALGITKRESSQSKLLASLPRDDFNKLRDGTTNLADVIRERKRATVKADLDDIAKKDVFALDLSPRLAGELKAA